MTELNIDHCDVISYSSSLLQRLPASLTNSAMPKERNFNPVQAQRKADKAKEIKKGKQTALRSVHAQNVIAPN